MSEPESLCGKMSSTSASKWEIEKAYFVGKQVGEFLTSPVFDALNAKWQIKIFPRGINEEFKDWTSIVMELLYCVKPMLASISMSLSDNNLRFASVHSMKPSFYTTDSPWKIKNMCGYNTLMANYKAGDRTAKFTISYEFVSDDDTIVSEPLHFSNALNNQQYSDVKFTVEGKTIYAHKIVLANKSKVFAAMFEHRMKENLDGIVEIEDVDYEVLLELLHYIYSGTVKNIEKVAKPLLVAAEKYDLIDLKTHCGVYLGNKLTVDNVKEYLDVAECCEVRLLKHKAVEFVKLHAHQMVEMPVFKLLMESHPDVVLEVVRCLSAKRPRLL